MVLTETARQPKQYLTRQLTPTTSELIWLRIWKIIIVKLIFHCKYLISKMENIIFDYEMFLGPVWLFYLGWLGRHLPKQGRSQRKLTSVHYKFTKNRWQSSSNHLKILIFFSRVFFFEVLNGPLQRRSPIRWNKARRKNGFSPKCRAMFGSKKGFEFFIRSDPAFKKNHFEVL